MVIRTLIILAAALLLVLPSAPVQACFGPKLFVAAAADVQSEALFALVTLYVQEKTGVESSRVEIEAGQDPVALLSGNKADLVFVPSGQLDDTVFEIPGLPLLVTGERPREDLQFTTVLPAINKLNRLLKQADVELVIGQIEAGNSALSAARKFLMDLRLI